MAILAIIVLGSGFFVGLRVSREAMTATGARYLEETRFHDFTISTALGLTDSELETIRRHPEVEAAEGSFNANALVEIGGDTGGSSGVVYSFYSLPSEVDVPALREGRLPSAPDECLADAWTHMSVGEKIRVAPENDEDTLELFTVREFTVTGIATSPLYLNYERGSASIGTGSVTAFCYVLPEVFDSEYYTSVNVRTADMPESFTDDYDQRSEELEDELQTLGETLAQSRYDTVVADAQKELDEGIADYEEGLEEYNTQRADADRELADAAKELEDAKKELEDAAQKLEDGRREIDEGWRELEDAETQGRQEIREAQDELDAARVTLVDGEKSYEDGLVLYEQGLADYNAGLEEYNKNYSEYEAGEAAYAQGLEQYNAGLAEYRENEALLKAAGEELEAARAQLEENQASLDTLLDTLAGLINSYVGSTLYSDGAALKDALLAGDPIAVYAVDTALAALAAYDSSLPKDSAELIGAINALAAGWEEYNKNLDEYNAAMDELADAWVTLEAAREDLEITRTMLDAAKAQLEDGWAELEDARLQLESSQGELEAARAQLDEGWLDYNTGLARLMDAREELERSLREARSELVDAQAEIDEGQKEYDEGLQEYEDGLREYEEAKAEADEEFADAKQELDDALAEIEDAKAEIADIEVPESYILGRWANVGYACFENDTGIVRSISKVFPLFFFLVAALMCTTTISRMVEEQRTQLGVLMALGYKPAAIAWKFLFYSGVATILGCAMGILSGSALIPLVVWQAYKIMYNFSDEIIYYFDVELSSVTFAAYLASMLIVTWVSCRRELSDTPANVIRPKAPKAGKRVLLERVPFIWRRLSFLWKVTVRNIFRYKQRVLMMVLGIAGCTALMLTGMGIRDSIQNVVDYQFDEISHYDFTVTFDGGLTPEEREEFTSGAENSASETLFLHQSSFTATANRTEKDVELCAVETDCIGRIEDFVDFHRGSTHLPFPEVGQVLVNSGLAEDLDIGAGDEIALRNGDGEELTLTVSGVYDNYIYNCIYISASTYLEETGREPEANSAMVLKAEGVDTGAAIADILGMEHVVNVSASEDLRARIGSMMASLIYIVLLTIGCAAALAFVVIYNLTNINITERLREIATVKVLGFYDKESAMYVLRENIILTVLGAAAGIPLGLALNAYVIHAIDIDLISFRPRVLLPSYILAVALTFLFSLLVDLMMCLKLNKINTAEALKAAE